MTKQEIVHLVDDLDGDTAHESVTFGLDGKSYEIDLSDDHAATLRDHLSSYVAAARTGPAPAARSRRQVRTDGDGPSSRPEAQAMRSWARNIGFELSDRGRIPAAVVQAYREAGDGTAAAARPATAPPSPPGTTATESPATASEPADADVLAWHEAKKLQDPGRPGRHRPDAAPVPRRPRRHRVAHDEPSRLDGSRPSSRRRDRLQEQRNPWSERDDRDGSDRSIGVPLSNPGQ